MRIFTKRFFELNSIDQAAVVHAVIRDLENCIGQLLDSQDKRKVRTRIKRIRRRANTHRVFSA